MPTHDYIIANGTGAAVRADINSALSAIVSLNSSASEPGTMYAYQLWADTGNNLLKIRNSANSAWITLRQLDGDFSIVAVEDGLQATPSLTFTNDLNTGVFRSGTDALAVVTGGQYAITCTSTQAVGIKTPNPSTALHVAGNARVGADDTTDAVLEIGVGATGNRNSYIDIVGDTTYTDYGVRFIRNNTGANATSELKHRGTGALNITTQEAAPIEFYTTNSPRVTIDSSGRLLVGTSTSAGTGALLQTRSDSLTALNQENFYSAANATGPNVIFAKSRGSVASPSVVSADDYLGIIRFRGHDGTDYDTSGAEIAVQVDGTPGANDMPGRLVFSTTADGAASPTERMRITNGGLIDIGGLYSVGANSIRFDVQGSNFSRNTTSSATQIAFVNPNGTIGTITTSGSATAYNTSSDYRLKENVSAVTNGITRLQQLKPSRFNFIAEPDKTVDGFIAHEVQIVVPEAITGEKDAVDDDGNPQYQGIDQSKLVPLLTAALQEAIAKIETLEARLTAAGL